METGSCPPLYPPPAPRSLSWGSQDDHQYEKYTQLIWVQFRPKIQPFSPSERESFSRVRPHGLYSLQTSPDGNTGLGRHFLLQGILLTQGPNPGLLHCGQMLYHRASWESQPLLLPPSLTPRSFTGLLTSLHASASEPVYSLLYLLARVPAPPGFLLGPSPLYLRLFSQMPQSQWAFPNYNVLIHIHLPFLFGFFPTTHGHLTPTCYVLLTTYFPLLERYLSDLHLASTTPFSIHSL